jgi:hypothetical protein
MAQLVLGTTIGGFTALHSGLSTVYLSGNVGIGTSSPIAKLNIVDDTNASFAVQEYHDGDGAVLRLYRAKGTIVAPTSPGLNDVLGSVRGFGYMSDTPGFTPGLASVDMVAAETISSTNKGAHLLFRTTTAGQGATTLIERMRIAHDGKVGINQVSPVEILDVGGNMKLSGYLHLGSITAPTHTNGRIYYDGAKLWISQDGVWKGLGGADPAIALTWTGAQTYNTTVNINQTNGRFVLPVGVDKYAT